MQFYRIKISKISTHIYIYNNNNIKKKKSGGIASPLSLYVGLVHKYL